MVNRGCCCLLNCHQCFNCLTIHTGICVYIRKNALDELFVLVLITYSSEVDTHNRIMCLVFLACPVL